MNANSITKRNYSAKQPLTLKLVEERVLLVLNLYDKIDGAKVDDFPPPLTHPYKIAIEFRVFGCVFVCSIWLSCVHKHRKR